MRNFYKYLLYVLVALFVVPTLVFANTVPWNRPSVGVETPLYTGDSLGVGVTTPLARVEIMATSSNPALILWDQNLNNIFQVNGNGATLISSDNSPTLELSPITKSGNNGTFLYLDSYASSVKKMTQLSTDASGNFGISPGAPHVSIGSSGTHNAGALLDVDGNASVGTFAFNALTQSNTNGLTVLGNTGVGTTSPFALLSVHTPNGSTGALSTLFAIASSTQAGATTTLFSIDRTGLINTGLSSLNFNVTGGTSGNAQILQLLSTSGATAANSFARIQNGNLGSDGTQVAFFANNGPTTIGSQNGGGSGIVYLGQQGISGSNVTNGLKVTWPGSAAGLNYPTINAAQAGSAAQITTADSNTSDSNVSIAVLPKGFGGLGIGTTTPTAILVSVAASTTAGTVQSGYNGVVSIIAGLENTVTKLFEEIDQWGHLITSGDTPGISGGTSSVSGNDRNGTITVTGVALTSVTLTFAHPYAATPECQVSDNTTASVVDIASISTTAVTFGLSVGINSGALYYACEQHQ